MGQPEIYAFERYLGDSANSRGNGIIEMGFLVLEFDDSQRTFPDDSSCHQGRTIRARPGYNLRAIQTITKITNIVPSIPYPNMLPPDLFQARSVSSFRRSPEMVVTLYPSLVQILPAPQPSWRFLFELLRLSFGLRVDNQDRSLIVPASVVLFL